MSAYGADGRRFESCSGWFAFSVQAVTWTDVDAGVLHRHSEFYGRGTANGRLKLLHTVVARWRNGSASDSRSDGWGFESLSGQLYVLGRTAG
jgi:hypothetical protein